MSLILACAAAGYNGGSYECAPIPGNAKYVAKWEGKLTLAELLQGDLVCEGILAAHSKKGKADASKLVLYPVIRDPQSTKEANQVVTLPDGYKEMTREAPPTYTFKINKVDMYLGPQLRKANNVATRYAIIDDKNQFLATFNADGEVIGRSGKFFVDGVDAKGFDKTSGEVMVELQADEAYETYDNPSVVKLSKAAPLIFTQLKDIQMYQKATATHAGGTAPTGGFTLTAVGADDDTIDVFYGTTSLTGGPVTKTSSESTVTLLAVKVAAAITAAVATNGGFTASNTAGALTITGPKDSSLNTVSVTTEIVGTMTRGSITAFSGAVDTNTTIKISGKISGPQATVTLDFYDDYSTSALGTAEALWSIKTLAGVAKTVTNVAPNAAGYFDVTSNALPVGTYVVTLAAPETLDAALVKGIEGNSFNFTKS